MGHTQNVTDDLDRKLRAIPFNNVDDSGIAGKPIQQSRRGLLYPVAHRRDRTTSEHRRHTLAIASVLRGLDGQQRWWPQEM